MVSSVVSEPPRQGVASTSSFCLRPGMVFCSQQMVTKYVLSDGFFGARKDSLNR